MENEKSLLSFIEALKESENKYRELVENYPDSIVIYVDGIIVFANKESLNLMGAAKKEELVGKSVLQFVHPDYRELVIERMTKMVSEGAVLPLAEEKLVRIDGTEVPVEIKAVPITHENKRAVQLIIRDITDSKMADLKLKRSHDLMRYIIEHNRSAIAVHDKDLKYIFVSQKYLSDYNIKDKSVIGKHHYEVFPDIPQKWRDVHQKALCGIVSISEDDPFEREDGTVDWTRWECRPWYETDSSIGGIIVYAELINERKKIEAELINSKEKAEESDRLKTAFLANISHEIRTPLNSILGFSEMLKEAMLNSEEQQEYTSIIEKSGNRMLNIIDEIISFSKIESGGINTNFSEVNINEQVESIYSHFKSEIDKDCNQILFKYSLPEKETIIISDKEKINTILTSLIRNAIKFTDSGYIEYGFEKRDKYLEFFVKDSGVGIPAAQKELIFERFRQGSESLTRNYEGIGLGLSISKAFVEVLGGKIWVESEEGAGSIFRFTIPFVIQS